MRSCTHASWLVVAALGCGPTVDGNGTFTVGEATTVVATSSSGGESSEASGGTAPGSSSGPQLDTSTSGVVDSSGEASSSGGAAESSSSETTGDPGLPPSATANCTLDSHVEPVLAQPELHIVGVYEASSDHSISAPAAVHVDRPGEVILVTSSYEEVTWTITAAPGTTITSVILNGYEPQTAMVPDGTVVDDRSGPGQSLASAAFEWSDPETAQLVAAVEGITGAALTSFHGCYQGSDFTIQ